MSGFILALDGTLDRFINTLSDDRSCIRAASLAMLLVLLAALWSGEFLPMQDYPQHLFMASVANDFDNPEHNWAEHFVRQSSFGPYRVSYLSQRFLGSFLGMEISGKVLVSLYFCLIALLAQQLSRAAGRGHSPWAVLLLFPLALHPMYFYGFLNFTLSLPVLLLALLDLRSFTQGPPGRARGLRHCLLVVAIFFLHPYTLMVYVVLATASGLLLLRQRGQLPALISGPVLALLLLLAWTAYSRDGSPLGVLSLESLNPRWWPLEWRAGFLAMSYSGMRFNGGVSWLFPLLWSALLVLIVVGVALRRAVPAEWRFLWLALLALTGFFVLPFSIQLDARYTFFNVRLAPISALLLVPFLAALPIPRVAGRLLALVSFCLVVAMSSVHLRVSREISSYAPLLEKMAPNASVMTLIGGSRSNHLDHFFYANFHYYFPFYYHIRQGGGVNPDMFNTRLMPLRYREGQRPAMPRRRQYHRWAEYRDGYDYVITRQVPRGVETQLPFYSELLDERGPWRLYRLHKRLN